MIAREAPVAAHVRPVTTVGVGLTEYHLAVYRPVVHPGRVAFVVTDRGEDPHDFEVRHGGRVLGHLPTLRPGRHATLTLGPLRPGLYRLLCTLPGHAAMGMRGSLHVLAR